MARMKSFRKSVLIAVLVLIASLFLPCLAQADQQAEEQAAMRAFQKFIKYIDNADARFYNCFDAHSKQVFVERTVNTLMKTYPDKTVEPEERRQELTQIFTEMLAEPDGQLAKSYMKQLRKYFLRKCYYDLVFSKEHSCSSGISLAANANEFTLEQSKYHVYFKSQNLAYICDSLFGGIVIYVHKKNNKYSISMTNNGWWVGRFITLSSDVLARHIQNASGSDTVYEPTDEDFVLAQLSSMVKRANKPNDKKYFAFLSEHAQQIFAEMVFNEFMSTSEGAAMQENDDFNAELFYSDICSNANELSNEQSGGLRAFFRANGIDAKASGLKVKIDNKTAEIFNSSGEKLFDMLQVIIPRGESWQLDLWKDREATTCNVSPSLWSQSDSVRREIFNAYEQGNFYNAHTKAVLAKIANKIWNREIEKIKNAKEVNAVDSTVAEVLVRFADCANKRSTDAWNIITSESQQYIIDTMAEAWHKENPGIEIESEDKLKENIRNLFQDPENQVNKAFWKALFDKLIKNGNYDIDISTLATAGDDDKKVVTAGTSAFYLVKEDSQWKIDIMKSEL